jgi:hypothetical protein
MRARGLSIPAGEFRVGWRLSLCLGHIRAHFEDFGDDFPSNPHGERNLQVGIGVRGPLRCDGVRG